MNSTLLTLQAYMLSKPKLTMKERTVIIDFSFIFKRFVS